MGDFRRCFSFAITKIVEWCSSFTLSLKQIRVQEMAWWWFAAYVFPITMWSIASFECTVAILNNCIGGWFSLKFFLRHNKKSACNVPNSVLTSFFPLFACPRYLSFTIRFVFIVNIYLMYGALWSIYIDIKPSRRNFDCQEQSIVSRRTTCEGRMAWLSITSNGSWCMGIKGDMSGTVCVTFTWDTYIYMSCL